MDIIARRPKPSVQEVFASDRNPPPAVLRDESPAHWLPTADVSAERYFSPDWHRREVEKVWRKTWQFACRVEDIPNPGDQHVYDIAEDSILIVRTGDGTIKGYVIRASTAAPCCAPRRATRSRFAARSTAGPGR